MVQLVVEGHDCIRLPGDPTDPRPPVRIFVGTEDGQARAERAFVWSIERVRDRTRSYQVHLLKALGGFDDRRWLTGFTNYRFLIPHLCEGEGRAIYNDVDQIYLRDPAELFDRDLAGHGYCALNERDTSVMLMDNARMLPVWPLADTRRERRKRLDARAAKTPGLFTRMDPIWNARDSEYRPGESALLHYTTIHTQPWQPFPGRFVYQDNPLAHLWHEIDEEAEAEGFALFGESNPSVAFRRLLDTTAPKANASASGEAHAEIAARLRSAQPASLLECGIGVFGDDSGATFTESTPQAALYDPSCRAHDKKPVELFDAVVWLGGLEQVPEADLPWLIEALFRSTRRSLIARVRDDFADPRGWRSGWPRDRFFWSEQFARAASKHAEVEWCLIGDTRAGGGSVAERAPSRRPDDSSRAIAWIRSGGFGEARQPRVWVLTDPKRGHTTQSLGLAERLGWPYEVRTLQPGPLNRLSNRLLGASLLGIDRQRSDPLSGPWPDLVIATGRLTAPVARWIAKQSHGHTRVILIGRRGGDVPDPFDLAVTCRHFRLLPHRRRLETLTPVNGITAASNETARRRWADLFPADQPAPIGMLVGGSSAHHVLDPRTARKLGSEVVALAGGRPIAVVTSPRTSGQAARALAAALGDAADMYYWGTSGDNPYLGILAHASTLVVTGESESMMGEAMSTGTPVYIAPLPARRAGVLTRLRNLVYNRAHARPMKRGKGSVRPQAGLERLLSRLLYSGLIRVHRDIGELHRSLSQSEVASLLGGHFDIRPRRPYREAERVARRVCMLMGVEHQPTPEGGREMSCPNDASAEGSQ
jgi:mitochondrial fission protein ELM1